MSNSSLVNYTAISPNSNNPRRDTIKKITIHHMAGNLSVETCGRVFSGSGREASSNYGIGTDGRVGMYVEEKNRAWTSASPSNDHQAITIEVANDKIGGDWHVSDTAMNKLIELCVDICKRNGIPKLIYTGDTTGNLTRHNMFTATACPGPYLQSKFPYIAEEVNKRLVPAEPEPAPEPTPPDITGNYKVGDFVQFGGGGHYSSANAGSPAAQVKASRAKVTAVYPTGKHPLHLRAVNASGAYVSGVYGWVDLSTVSAENAPPPAPSVPTLSYTEGEKVAIKSTATQYFPGGANIPGWVKSDYFHIITQTTSRGKPVTKGGKPCVLLGKKVNKKNGQTVAGINTWIAKENLTTP